jgi:hypothetical protein
MEESSFDLNLPQLMVECAEQANIDWEGARGCGKSVYIARRIQTLALAMPRGTFSIAGNTFSQLLTRTLMSTKHALEKLGWIEGIHYFIGRKPPAKYKWDLAYEAPVKPDHFLYTFTGAGFHLVSMMEDNGRGLNSDANISDEKSTFDEEKYNVNVTSTLRGNLDKFGKHPLHHSTFSTYNIPISKKGEWVYKNEQLAIEKPKDYFYLRSSSHLNKHNLGEKFFEKQRAILTPLLYSMEIDNIRPRKLEGGFYPNFGDHNLYPEMHNEVLSKIGFDFSKLKETTSLLDGDCNRAEPLDIALDYNHKFNCLVVGQNNYDFADDQKEYRYLNSFFVKSPRLLDALVQDFCDYYSQHRNKVVHYYYDQTAIAKKSDSELAFKDTVLRVLRANHWDVIEHYFGSNPSHHSRYLFWMIAHQGHPNLPKMMHNETKNKYLIIALNNADAKKGKNGFEKDKTPERKVSIPDEETTHFTEAYDNLGYYKFISRLIDSGDWVG